MTSRAVMYALEKWGGQKAYEMKILNYLMLWVQRNWMQNVSNSVIYLQSMPRKSKTVTSVKSQDIL